MNNVGIYLRGIGWDGRRCGTIENLAKFSENLGGLMVGMVGGTTAKVGRRPSAW